MEQVLMQLNKGDFICLDLPEEEVQALCKQLQETHGGMFQIRYLRSDLTHVTCYRPVSAPLPATDSRINRRPPLRKSA